jgi:hypothetical protein
MAGALADSIEALRQAAHQHLREPVTGERLRELGAALADGSRVLAELARGLHTQLAEYEPSSEKRDPQALDPGEYHGAAQRLSERIANELAGTNCAAMVYRDMLDDMG